MRFRRAQSEFSVYRCKCANVFAHLHIFMHASILTCMFASICNCVFTYTFAQTIALVPQNHFLKSGRPVSGNTHIIICRHTLRPNVCLVAWLKNCESSYPIIPWWGWQSGKNETTVPTIQNISSKGLWQTTLKSQSATHKSPPANPSWSRQVSPPGPVLQQFVPLDFPQWTHGHAGGVSGQHFLARKAREPAVVCRGH